MSISKKKYKIMDTKVYYHSKKGGKIAVRVIGKYLYDFGFREGDFVRIKIETDKITITNTY